MDGNGVEATLGALLDAIRDHGPIGFDEFMTVALYGPEGYYAHPPVGATGDFVTSPHVHPVFGMLLAKAIRSLHTGIGAPAPFLLTEVGAGDGTLARQLLAELVGLDLRYTAVEISAGARDALASVDGVEVATELTRSPHVIVANELLDNLPFRRIRGDREIAVTATDDGRLVETEIGWDGEPGPPDAETIVPIGALAFVDRMAETLAGYAILIDYGDVGAAGGGAHGYRAHRVVEDTLVDPGGADITAGVDFHLIATRAHADGLVAFPSISQREALIGLGFDTWLRSELERQTDLLDASQGLEAVRTWGGRSRATLLVDPSALGRLRWLVLASPGLPRPAWLP